MASLALFIVSSPAQGAVSAFFFSDEDPQYMLNKQYKAYVLARTFQPGTIRKYQKRLVDVSRPLPKSVRSFVDTNIDWTAYAKFTFGSNWGSLAGDQKKDFKALVRKLHLKKYGKHFSPSTKFSAKFNKPTAYRLLKGRELAKVRTLFISTARNIKFDVDFIFCKGPERWALCDIYVDDVSSSRTYRRQIKRIYKKQGYAGVMKALRRALSRV